MREKNYKKEVLNVSEFINTFIALRLTHKLQTAFSAFHVN